MSLDLSKRIDELRKDDAYPDFELWVKNGIYSESIGAKVAPEDLWIVEGGALKRYFTQSELLAFEKKVLIPKGWRILTDDEWQALLTEFGTEDGETSHKLLMQSLGLIYGGYVQEECVDDYNRNPHNPDYIHNLGNTGCYASSCDVDDDSADPTMLNRYFYFLKDRDALYGYEYVGTCGTAVREAYLVRCVAVS